MIVDEVQTPLEHEAVFNGLEIETEEKDGESSTIAKKRFMMFPYLWRCDFRHVTLFLKVSAELTPA